MKYEKRREDSNKLENTLLAAAGVVVGGALLHKAGGTKYLSKAIGDISHTMKKVSNDINLVGRKGMTAEKTSELFRKHISNSDSTWKLRRNETPTIKINSGLFGDLDKLKNLDPVFRNIDNKNKDMELNRYAFNKLSDRFKYIKNRDEAFMKELYNLTERSLNKKSRFFEQGTEPGEYVPILKEFQKATKGNLLEGKEEEIADVLKDALSNAEKIQENAKKISPQAEDDFKKLYEEHIRDKYKRTKNEGDRAATAREIYEAIQEEKAKAKGSTSETAEEFVDRLGRMLEKDPSIGDLVVDPKTYRMDANNQFYSLEDLRETARKAEEGFSETIAGKLFATKNFIEGRKAPDIFHFSAGTFDPGLAKVLGAKDLLPEDVTYIGGKYYRMKESGLEHIVEADGRVLKSGRAGTIFGYLDRMSGNAAQRNQQNEFFKFLDVGTKGGEYLDEMKSILTKFSKKGEGNEWGRNIIDRLFNKYNPNVYTPDDVRNFQDDAIALSKIYNENTRGIDSKTINGLKEVLSDKAKPFLEAMEADDPLDYISTIENFNNADLKSLKNRVFKNEELKSTMTRATKNSVIQYEEILQRELLKEALLRDANLVNGISGYAVTLSKLEKAGIDKNSLSNVKDIFNWGLIQSKANVFAKDIYTPKTFEQKRDAYETVTRLFNGTNSNSQEDAFLKEFRKSVVSFVKDNTSLTDKLEINKNTQLGYTRPQWMTTKQNVSPLDIIKSINDDTKDAVKTTESFVKQFFAGRNNIEDVSTLTMIPYHLVNRLATPLEHIGLGFSNASTGSTLDIAKNLMLKRALPVAGLLFTASYLNYEAENLTGTSFTEAFYNAQATFGVGIRTLATPFNKPLERAREYNPLVDYWFGEYKDKDEYLDYLEYGYDPVRKGRFWSFGSSSEFRGGKISYWEPNKLRQAHSNYRDIAIYGSSEEKWKHSLIPTLRHPFSTFRYLANPYWLEEKHYEDRPYPVTGKMFSEGTPWGAILNPTVGELIKPQKRMHQEHLQGTGLDVRSIIQQRNQDIKDKAQENRIIRIDESGLTPMMFTPESMPSMSEAIYNIQINNGQITSAGYLGQQYAETMDGPETAQYAPTYDGSMVTDAKVSYGVGRLNSTNDYDNKHAAAWISGIAALATSGAVEGSTAISMIEQVNDSIKFRSESTQRGQWFEKARMHTNPSYRATQQAKLDYTEQMIDMNTKADYVHDMIFSGKQLSGMYGFIFDQLVSTPKAYRLEHAGKMASFSRQFWDESIGGLGGNIMEIARRFFPHEDHNVENINPIRNTMEEWLPARFQTGDPYTKVTKGEARLPGAGYEALNKLRSDKYGRYGALDRMKILGDIAPLSEEYKVWKKIAKAEYTDAQSKKEIAAIEARVKAQTKEHDFYNYKFLGKDMAEHTAVIDEVSNTGKFTVVGSNQEFSLAGIKPVNDEEGNSYVHEYLKPGMIVRLQFENNEYRNRDSEGRISAIVKHGISNINADMFYEGTAKEKETRETLADERYKLTEMNSFMGPIWEAIGHAPIPFIHNKFMRINSSLETYRHEQVYGTAYSTWDHPIKGFLKPAFQEAIASTPVHQALGVGAWALSEYASKNISNKTAKTVIDTAFGLVTPGAFAGGMIASLPKMKISNPEGKLWTTRNGARIGAAVTLAGFALTNTQNPLMTAGNFALAGLALQEQFKFKGANHLTGALIGAGVGLAISGLNPESNLFNLSKKWIPEDTEKKWEIEEYFDRLEYIKYTNLYHRAAKEAKRKEGVDVESIVNQYERNKEKNAKLIEKLEEQKKKAERMIDEQAREKLIAEIDYKLSQLMTPIQYLKSGEYTKAAIAYKKAADTTIYGLSADATTADVLRALPKYDRDFFLDFANEKDPKKRKEILKYVSPYKARALKIMWGEEVDEAESNQDFFNNHNLPNMFWSGWQPQIDLEHVKMKTIENEGMLLSDFGMYDSNKSEPAAMAAPEIRDMHKAPDPISLQANLVTLMNGVGFSNVDVSVEPTNKPGIQMLVNMSRVTSYNLNNSVSSVLSKLIL